MSEYAERNGTKLILPVDFRKEIAKFAPVARLQVCLTDQRRRMANITAGTYLL